MYRKILVALDGSRLSLRAMDEAIQIAKLTHAHVHGVYVLDRAPAFPYTCHYDMAQLEAAFSHLGHASLDEATRALAVAGVDADTELIETKSMTEDIAACLQRCVKRYKPDLVVMGTHGRRGMRRSVFGSVAEQFVRGSTCPVLLVRAKRGKS
ncbi:MAG: universal stress protein [Paraburkholderia sp.]|uniref:universal stress protein n=1 Tax=Paraburkholderia sp. TaxID=1926495 RepID=UPI0012025CA8|nr:universal stress protein [Paraburkholderia sp.]TAM04422.1 MAG: universal stress protein [Paraburkholderia sp.]TAM32798.1 MAG: universal stress protein [Paraburkholderia sp.]